MYDPTAMPSSSLAPTSAMFAERSERVYFMARERVDQFIAGVGAHLGLHAFDSSLGGVHDPAAHYVTTLYFDSPLRDLASACEAGGDNIRLRTREYHDRGSQGARFEPFVWMELKARTGERTRKRRFGIPLDEVNGLLGSGVISSRLLLMSVARSHWAPAELLEEIVELGARTRGPLGPDCVVQYRRHAWQDDEERVRITLDTELSYHAAPPQPFNGRPLCERLGPTIGRLAPALVEIKLRRECPDWLDALADQLVLTPAYAGRHTFSKFVAASQAVHGIGNAPHPRSS
jgi:hypothetical protein